MGCSTRNSYEIISISLYNIFLAVIPKSIKEDRMIQNLQIFDFELDSEDLEFISKLDKNYHYCWDPTDIP